jgi:thymidine kinase
MVLGPMKSGKSFELISYFAPLKYTDIPYIVLQSAHNVRDEKVWSRNGLTLHAEKVASLGDIDSSHYEVIGIDEIHMFPEDDALLIRDLLKQNKRILVSGLEMDYRGEMFPIVQKLLSLGPREVKFKRAVCEKCKVPDAIHTQILHKNKPLTSGLPPVVPEDGTYVYQAVCRRCFVHA